MYLQTITAFFNDISNKVKQTQQKIQDPMIKTPTFLVFPTISCQKPNRPKNHQDQINPKTIKPRKNTRWIYHIFSLLVRKRNGVYILQNTWVGVGSYFGASRQWGPKRRDWQWQSQGGESQSGWPKTHLSKSRPIPIEDSEEPRDSWPQICQKQPAFSLSLIRVRREKKKRIEWFCNWRIEVKRLCDWVVIIWHLSSSETKPFGSLFCPLPILICIHEWY